jgi:hypothetical protein
MSLKYLFFYYFMIVTPLLLLVLFAKMGSISSTFFSIGLLIYTLIYHPVISGIRLMLLGKIDKSDFFKNFIPFWNLKYAKDLFCF